MNAVFRLTTLFFAILLGAQSVWLLLPELLRPDIDRLPTDAASAADAARHRTAASLAASIGTIRGDLWAESAFTYSDLLWGNADPNRDLTRALQRVRATLGHTLKNAPHQSGAWLFLAALVSRYPSPNYNATEALRMSYYTGPSEQDLMPLRLYLTAQLDKFGDVEMRQFVSRDLRLLIGRKQTSVTAQAYNVASPAGKRFIEQTVKDIDPSMMQSLQSPVPGKSVPN